MSEENPETPKSLTKEDLAEVLKETLPQQQEPEPKKMTEEELAEYLQVWQPDSDYVESLQHAIVSEESTPEERMRALTTLRDGIVNQATRGAELMLEKRLNEFQQEVAPATQYAQQAQAEALWNDFTEANPHLKDQKELVDMVATNIATSGWKPKSKEELFEKVKEGTEGLLKKLNPNFDSGQQASQQSAAQMPDMASAGGAPQGGPGSAVPQRGDVASVWD